MDAFIVRRNASHTRRRRSISRGQPILRMDRVGNLTLFNERVKTAKRLPQANSTKLSRRTNNMRAIMANVFLERQQTQPRCKRVPRPCIRRLKRLVSKRTTGRIPRLNST